MEYCYQMGSLCSVCASLVISTGGFRSTQQNSSHSDFDNHQIRKLEVEEQKGRTQNKLIVGFVQWFLTAYCIPD